MSNYKNTLARSLVLVGLAGASVTARAQQAVSIPYDALADRIVTALQVSKGEHVVLRYNPDALGPLEPAVRSRLTARGAVVESLRYGPVPDFETVLARTDVYIWLPAGDDNAEAPDQRPALAKWLDAGRGRQIHFHWGAGTVDRDGRAGVHSPEFDRVYIDALDIDYAKLSAVQDRALDLLRSGEIRVTDPGGTDIRFRVGDRAANKQDGNATKARADKAKMRVDREIELPSGVLRIAPIETTVNGVLVVPAARLLPNENATGIRLEFANGKVTRASAQTGNDALQRFLDSSPTLRSFRELGLGFNPKLRAPAGSPYLAYYGYGDAVVRLAIGDNTELAGDVRGGASRWLFFPDTTITVGTTRLVEKGKLTDAYRYR
jgi:hypothetical protein